MARKTDLSIVSDLDSNEGSNQCFYKNRSARERREFDGETIKMQGGKEKK